MVKTLGVPSPRLKIKLRNGKKLKERKGFSFSLNPLIGWKKKRLFLEKKGRKPYLAQSGKLIKEGKPKGSLGGKKGWFKLGKWKTLGPFP